MPRSPELCAGTVKRRLSLTGVLSAIAGRLSMRCARQFAAACASHHNNSVFPFSELDNQLGFGASSRTPNSRSHLVDPQPTLRWTWQHRQANASLATLNVRIDTPNPSFTLSCPRTTCWMKNLNRNPCMESTFLREIFFWS